MKLIRKSKGIKEGRSCSDLDLLGIHIEPGVRLQKYSRSLHLVSHPYDIDSVVFATSLYVAGTVKDLDQHHYDYASKHLASHGVYILVEKQVMVADEEETDDSSSQLTPHYTYRPLLDKCTDLYPNFRVQEHHTPEKRPPRKTQKSQSPSPAGLRNKGRSGKGNLSTRAPSRRK